MFKKYGNNKEIARAMFLYISYSILGPLLLIGGIGYFIDKVFETRFALLFSVFIAYIVSNILMFKKLKSINYLTKKIGENKSKLEDDDKGDVNKLKSDEDNNIEDDNFLK